MGKQRRLEPTDDGYEWPGMATALVELEDGTKGRFEIRHATFPAHPSGSDILKALNKSKFIKLNPADSSGYTPIIIPVSSIIRISEYNY